jgi:hypothetical protein
MGHVVTRRRHRTYPLHRSGADQPSEAVMALSHAAWRAFSSFGDVPPPDPHLFPNLYRVFRGALRNRLLRYAVKPSRSEGVCRHCGGGSHLGRSEPTYLTLEITRPLPDFARGLAALAVRRMVGALRLTREQRSSIRRRLREEIGRALMDHVRVDEQCVHCDPRQGFPDRRVWLAGASEALWRTWAPGVGHDWTELDMDLLDEE